MLIKVSEAAKELGLSTDHLRRLIRAGKIPVYNMGPKATRLDLDEVKSLRRITSTVFQDSEERVGAK